MTRTHRNTRPVSKVPVQAAQVPVHQAARQACVTGGAHRNADGGCREQGDRERSSLDTRLRFLNALRLINGNVSLSSFFLVFKLVI